MSSKAQTNSSGDLSSANDTLIKNQKANLDTEESLKYIGSELLFQVKKRLHLTTEEEEKQKEQQKGKKSVVFNILGIKIERG